MGNKINLVKAVICWLLGSGRLPEYRLYGLRLQQLADPRVFSNMQGNKTPRAMIKYDMGFSPGRGCESRPQWHGFPMYIAVEGPASPKGHNGVRTINK